MSLMQIPALSPQESSYVDDVLTRVSKVCDMEIMETEMLKKLWDIVESVLRGKQSEIQRYGLLIIGPPGVGKTTALIYLMHKLKLEGKGDHGPCVLFCSLGSGRRDSFMEYLTWFCEGVLIHMLDFFYAFFSLHSE